VLLDVARPSVIKDPKDPDPSRRYKMIAHSHKPAGYHTFVSPDGLTWRRLSETPIAPDGDVITGYYDRRLETFVAFPKIHRDVLGIRRRSFSTITSEDFVHWSAPVPSFTNDLRDDAGSLARIEAVRAFLDEPDSELLMRTEYYGIGAYQAESCTIALPWLLTINNRAKYGNHQGPMGLQLAASRDLIHWSRPFREAAIEHGGITSWDSVNITSPSEAIRVGDEIWVYYSGGNQAHGVGTAKRTGMVAVPGHQPRPLRAAIGLAKWNVDRFISADGPKDGGTLETVPLKFAGDLLEINAAVKHGGGIVVELLDAGGIPLPGWTESDRFTGNTIAHPVVFGGRRNLSSLSGRAISLRFHLRDASLYSFAFRARGDSERVAPQPRNSR
jgi:hypothetical protein